MLVMTRREGESIQIDDNIVVRIERIDGSQVKVSIDAPHSLPIVRTEMFKQSLHKG
jgi:carbon storage regulator